MNYTIEGAPMPVVICNLEGGETMLTEKAAMLSRIHIAETTRREVRAYSVY